MRYEEEKEKKLDEEEIRKAKVAEDFKNTQLNGLHEQAAAKRKEKEDKKRAEEYLDKLQIRLACEKDEALKAIDFEKE